MYILFTDTDTDITPEIASEYGYKLISMPYSINDKEIYPYIDFDKFDSKEFYNSLRKGVMPKTSGLSPEQYTNYFEPYLKEGKDILYVHFSANMSGTFNAMHLAIEDLKEKYPNNNVYTVDTKGITLGSYNIVREIGDMYKAGKSIEEILTWSSVEVDKFATYFFVDDLKFFMKSGRVKYLTGVMGNLIGIHPIIYMDKDGIMTSIDKARGMKNTLDKILNYVDTLQENIKDHRVIIGHTDSLENATKVGNILKEKYGEDLNIEYVVVNPTAGSHCGPDGVGICFHAIHR